jgi:hypothetical protein
MRATPGGAGGAGAADGSLRPSPPRFGAGGGTLRLGAGGGMLRLGRGADEAWGDDA